MKSMLRTSIVLMFVTICSKILGLGREISLSYTYGISSETDAYIIAIAAPGLLFTILSAGINSCFVPIYSSIVSEYERNLYTSRIANIFLFFTISLCAIIYFFSTQIVNVYGYGFNLETKLIANDLLKVTCFSLIIRIMVVIYASNLQVKGFFIINNLIGIPMNLIIICSILLSSPENLAYLSNGFLLAMFSQLILIFPVLFKEKVKYIPSISISDKHIQDTAILILPVGLVIGINELNLMIDIMISSNFSEGAVTALNYALKISILVQSVLVATVVLILFPSMSKLNFNENYKEISKLFNNGSKFFIYIISPIAVFTAFNSEEVVSFVYGYGKFDFKAVQLTSEALFYYSFGFIFFAFRELMLKTLYSQKNMKAPFKISIIGVFFNLTLTLALSNSIGFGGVALATSFAAFIVCILLLRKLNSKILIDTKGLLYFALKIVFTSIILSILLSIDPFNQFLFGIFWFPAVGFLYIAIFVLITMHFKEKPLSLMR